MRLLNTITLEIHDFTCKKIPKYAILSHSHQFYVHFYRNAQECYAYLNDVPGNLDQDAKIEALRQSKWFTRGWTLQELLAPTELYFLDSNWKIIGSKKTLNDVLSEITGIENVSKIDPSTVSVAARMSWASKRECSREEDNAYCLMGIFGINMPLLYGEREKAFERLQLQILKTSDYESLFAWWNPEDDFKLQTGLLATSPHNFRDSADISPYPFYPDRGPYDMTNKGLQIEACLPPCKWLLETVTASLTPSRRRAEESPTSPQDDIDNAPTFEVNSRYAWDKALKLDRRYQFGDNCHRFRGDQYRPFHQSTSELSRQPRIWIFPLNCRAGSNLHPVVLILRNWGTKKSQCCRLFSKKSTDTNFGPDWTANWRGFGGITRLTNIREADAKARWALGKMYTK